MVMMGWAVGWAVLGLALEAFEHNRYRMAGYAAGVKDCMAGRAEVTVTADTAVAYPK